MPAWITPLLCVVWCSPSLRSRSSSTTRSPRSASARAVARPTIPPPATATSCITSIEEVQGGADDRLGVDLVVLVQLPDVAGLAEALDAEAAHRLAVDRGQEAQRVRVAVEQRDDRQRLVEQRVEDPRVALCEPGAGLERPE